MLKLIIAKLQNLGYRQSKMSQIFSLQAFIFVIILLIYLLTSHIIQTKQIPYIHESTVAILMGIMTAVFAKYVPTFINAQGLNQQIKFSNDLFFAIILPPIIFAAGYDIRKSMFFQNIRIIMFLGIAGTLIGFICLVYFLIFINDYIFNALTLGQILLISSVLCATDPVSAMSLLKVINNDIQAKKYPILNSLLFGQGIINDAVAIILFRTISQLKIDQTNEFTGFTVLRIAFDFTYMFVFSVAFGAITGLGLSYLFKKLKLKKFTNSGIKQTSLILLNGYFTYLMGELLGISGIISLFTCAVIMGNYCYFNISQQSQKGTGLAFDTVSYIAEAFVFAYLGASVLSIQGKLQAVIMALIILASLPVIRAIIIFSLPIFYRIIDKRFSLSLKQLKICWFSGIIRGVVAFALCLQIYSKDKKYITTIVIVIVMITTLLSSTLLQYFMKYVGFSINRHKMMQEQQPNQKIVNQNEKMKQKTSIIQEQVDSGRDLKSRGLELQNFQEKFKVPAFQKMGEMSQAKGEGKQKQKQSSKMNRTRHFEQI